MSSEVLRMERRDGAAVLTIDRPHAGNSISAEVTAALDEAVDALEDDGDLVAIVITGAGDKFFSSGGDIKGATDSITEVLQVLLGDATDLKSELKELEGILERG